MIVLPRFPFALLRFCALLAVFTVSARSGTRAAEKLQYNKDIRPILSDRCFKCHGPDKGSRKAGLRLDIAEEAYAERKKTGKHAIVPGKPDKSLVCEKIFSTDPDDQMPPPEANLALTVKEKETLRRWVAEGAVYQPHWAFLPVPSQVQLPKVRDSKWARNGIDRFVLARLEKEKLKPSREAEGARWLRRVSYDLTGLPPTPEERDSFLADRASDPCEKVVDRLLASPRYGERMAVPWLDAARYADSYGYQSDQLCPTWPYRDWVINAFNQNLAYDKFLMQQLAGDLLPNATREQRLATAFNRLHRQTNEGGSIEEEWRTEYVSDRVATFSTSMLGLTFECARCHDHKYDPIKQRDYYSLSAFFNSIDEYGLYNDGAHIPTPSLLLPNSEQEKAVVETAKELERRRKEVAEAKAAATETFPEWSRTNKNWNIPGLVSRFDFEKTETNNQFASIAGSSASQAALGANARAEGHHGKAVKFSGEDELSLPGVAGSLQPSEPYTFSSWLKLPAGLTNGIIFHRCTGTDTGFHGTELRLENNRLFYVIKRFWPGNALAIKSVKSVPAGEWLHLAVSYDGSAQAKGMRLYLNGEPLEVEVVRDHLYKAPENGGSGFSFGAMMRSTGLKDAVIDDVSVYNRALSKVEVAALAREESTVPEPGGSTDDLKSYFLNARSETVQKAEAQMREAVQKYYEARNPLREISVMEETEQPRPTFLLARGRYDAPRSDKERVERIIPPVLNRFPAEAPRNRLGLSQWLTDPANPLTARVAVNRLWQMCFGRGLVLTAENFGTQGADPSHPELLDWLARDFMDSGWDTKRMLKQIVLSATYRQDSRLRPDLKQRDPENVLLARGPSHRLSGEMIRDSALAAGGLLDEKMGGPPVSPYSPGDLWRESNAMSPAYHQSTGTDLYRRSVYTVWKRTAPPPDMSAFDAPSREVCLIRRSVTSTPQQAFVLLNDVQFVEAARVLAEQALTRSGEKLEDRIAYAFRKLAARNPEPNETALLQEAFEEQLGIFKGEPERATALVSVGEKKAAAASDVAQLAAMTTVVQTIMNSDAMVWER
jgi:hypothetical protein